MKVTKKRAHFSPTKISEKRPIKFTLTVRGPNVNGLQGVGASFMCSLSGVFDFSFESSLCHHSGCMVIAKIANRVRALRFVELSV
jgi:hypothetical protein